MVTEKQERLIALANMMKDQELTKLSSRIARRDALAASLEAAISDRQSTIQQQAVTPAYIAGMDEIWFQKNTQDQAALRQAISSAAEDLEAQKRVAQRAFGRAQVLVKIMARQKGTP